MQRKKILWLVSWYPNRNDLFDGDFIQRHARAAAIYHDIHVMFVADAAIETAVEEEWTYATGLTEQIIYFKKPNGFLGRFRKQWSWKNVFQTAIEKYVHRKGKPDHVHVHVPWKAGLMALWMKKKYGTDFIITEHWGIYNDVIDNNFHTKSSVTRKLIKKLFLDADAFISVSKFLASGVERLTGKKADAIIANVVDTSLFYYKDEKYSKFTFIHISNMVVLKNVKGILDAFKEVVENRKEELQLIMIGNRDNEYVKYAQELGVLNQSVFFRGEISYREVAEEMRRSHCFVLNSMMENSPCVIGEALCCGLPVVATNVGGIPELVNETNSRLLPVADRPALTKAMQDVWMKYQSYNRKQISEEASKIFSYTAIAESFLNLYASLD